MGPWLVLPALLALLALGGTAALLYFCGRTKAPDYWEEETLLSHGQGQRRGDALSGKAALEPRPRYSVEVTADDDVLLKGTLLTCKNPRGTALLFHDRRGSWKLDCSGLAAVLLDRGYQVLMPDQRAHDRSGGRWCTWGVWERFDVRAWTNFALLRFGPDHPLWIGGVGMGGTAALMAASLDLEGNVRGVFSEGAYTAPLPLLRWRAARLTPIPVGPLLWLLDMTASLLGGFRLGDYSAVTALREAGYPALLFHGGADSAVPVSMARELSAACTGDGELVVVEGADHGCCRLTDPERFEAALFDFFARTVKTPLP